MFKKLTILAAAASVSLTAVPATAQDAEEARTTYRIEYINFTPGGAAEWSDAMEKYIAPARREMGMPEVQVHWLMAGDWEVMTVTEMREGLAALDQHQAGRFEALNKNIMARFPSPEEAKANKDKIDASITGTSVTYSHTHP